jgi:ATPase family associated with various cellular activities (AAA)
MSTAPEPISFAALAALVRSSVESVAATEPDPVDPFRGLYLSDQAAVRLAGDDGEHDLDARLDSAAALLGLSRLEGCVLALCAAPELHPRYGRLYGYLHDDLTRRLPSPRLIARLLDGVGFTAPDVLACFDRCGRLRASGALRIAEGDASVPLAERGAQAAERLVAFLLGVDLSDTPPDLRIEVVRTEAEQLGRERSVAELAAMLALDTPVPLLVAGPDAAGIVAAAAGRPVVLVDAVSAGDPQLLREAALVAALERGLVALGGVEQLEPAPARAMQRWIASRSDRVILCGRTRAAAFTLADLPTIVVEVPEPSLAERRAAWRRASGADDVEDVAAKFRLSIGQVEQAAEVAKVVASSAGRAPGAEDLDFGARSASSGALGQLATRLELRFGWDDLILPPRSSEVLQSISAYIRHRDLVLSEWGYERTVARNQGVKTLFAGDSGTGKTMAAQVLASDLGQEIFRIDLATVVSKYIGETEKNLDRIFAAAQGSNAILFFDEADALFGKRSDVQDAHDRYANLEVAYLLQRMESYAGAVVLATNYRQNIDEAFLRRLDFVVDFPFPEPPDRERIWRLLLPRSAPQADDVDITFLAHQFKLAGGNIRNASLAAAFLAAEDGGVIAMRHLVRGVALEYGKLGRLTLESDFEQFHDVARALR